MASTSEIVGISHNKATRPEWIFDGSEIEDPFGFGERAVDFLRRLKHPKSESGDFELPLFWERIVRRIYGPCCPNKRRQVKTVFILLPRGARKTTMGAGLALLHTVGWERVPGGQAIPSYIAAGAVFRCKDPRLNTRIIPGSVQVADGQMPVARFQLMEVPK
ncbi:hypothetical protein RMR21_006260 [Agrobacterium sp. rho-8.1]|nr:hypothetical protein [Agrobacterium sp. rho-8.1]